ncbi:hypothetical protein MAM1_1231c11525, partial [Mucor ambiguus]
FAAHGVFAVFFGRKSRTSTIQSTVAVETTIKVLGYVNMPFNIATNVFFENENENDVFDSKDDGNGTANAVEAKVMNGHAEQETVTDNFALPPTANYSEIWTHSRPDFSR